MASGAATLTYRVRWRRANGGAWCAAQAYETGAPLDAVPLETLKHGVPIRVPAGGGEVEVCASAKNGKGWGARTQKQRRAKSFCMALGPDEHDAHTAAELKRQPAAAEAPANDDAPAPRDPGSHGARLGRIRPGWTSSSGRWPCTCAAAASTGACSTRTPAGRPSGTSCGPAARRPEVRVPRPPISPVAALACLIPGRSAAALLPTKARLLLDDGSPIASLWWGANDAIDVDAIEAAVDAAVPRTFGTPVIVDAKGRTVVKLLGDGAAAYPPLPERVAAAAGAAPPRGPAAPPRGPSPGRYVVSPPPAHARRRAVPSLAPPATATPRRHRRPRTPTRPPPAPSLAKRPPPRARRRRRRNPSAAAARRSPAEFRAAHFRRPGARSVSRLC